MLAKKMTKDRVDIKIEDQHLTVVIRSAEGEQEFELQLPLYSKVSSSMYPLVVVSCMFLCMGVLH